MPLPDLVSPLTGLVRGADEVFASPDDCRLVHVECVTGDCSNLTGVPGTVAGGGSGRTLETASLAAIAEVAERYSAAWTDDAEPLLATAEELGPGAVAPERFALFSERQYAEPGFPYMPFTRETRVAWVRGRSLSDGSDALLPAQLVYLGWRLVDGEAPIATATSSGLAAHVSFERAAVEGLLELLERDAFMITWGARLSWPRLVWPVDHTLAEFFRRYLAPTELVLAAVDMSSVWGVPCVLGIARSTVPGQAPLGVGAAAGGTVERAVEKALAEAVRVRSWSRALRTLVSSPPDPDAIVHFEDHIAYYAHDSNLHKTTFLDASRAVRSVESVTPIDESLIVDRVKAYVVDVAAPDVRDAGVAVVRVVAPELCQLDVIHRHRYLGGRRRLHAPVDLGFTVRALTEDELNPDPHPFP